MNTIEKLVIDNWFEGKVGIQYYWGKKSMINNFNLCLYISLFLTMFNAQSKLYAQSGKPDLIITNVVMKYERPNRIHIPGEPVSGSDNLPQPNFYVTVSNIGNKDFSKPFYIVYTSDEKAIINGYYSGGLLANQEQRTIGIKDSIVIRIIMYSENYRYCKFHIDTDGKYSKESSLPIIEEENYDNNSFECSFE
jgi:hypothetical protein